MAGVSMPSPKNSARPSIAAVPIANLVRRPSPGERWASEASARIPPSPSLSARMMSRTYLTVTTMISDQTISDTTPMMADWTGT